MKTKWYSAPFTFLLLSGDRYRIENGEYVIVEDEAEVVKQIFKNYLSGVAKKTIADMLNSMNVPNREGTPWQRSTVEYILGNERYTGNAVFQKTYTDAAEPFKNKPNNGKVPKYFVEDTNPPMISKEEYEAAVRLTEERRNRKPYKKTADRTLNGKIRCSCGGTFGRKKVSGKAYWSCNIHESDSGKCNSRRVPEDDIYEAYIAAVNKLREYRREILLPAIQQTENLYMRAGNSTLIYNDFLAGATYLEIAKRLTEENVPTMGGGNRWFSERIKSILKNEKYKGDALLQKTYITDPISKRVKKNNGELPMYYVENSHPAIIERRIFDRVQEEIARRAGKKKVKQTGTKTELGRYSGKYALTELLYCGECGTPYRRCTWSRDGKKKIVWRCVSRLDYGKKYCKNSPSVEESRLHNAIAAAITKKANSEEINIGGIMNHIESFGSRRDTDGIIQRQRRIAEIEKVIDDLARLNSDEAQSGELDYKFSELYAELYSVKDELEEMQSGASALNGDMLNEMREVVTGLKNHPVEYDDKVVRQLIDCIKVMSADTIKICFKDGTVTETAL